MWKISALVMSRARWGRAVVAVVVVYKLCELHRLLVHQHYCLQRSTPLQNLFCVGVLEVGSSSISSVTSITLHPTVRRGAYRDYYCMHDAGFRSIIDASF